MRNFKKPITFPQDKEDPAKKDKSEAVILGHFVDKLYLICFSHPSLRFIIKMVVPSKFSKFPEF